MKRKISLFLSTLLLLITAASCSCSSKGGSRIDKAARLGTEDARNIVSASHKSDFATERAILQARSTLTLLNDEDVRLGDAYLEALTGELASSDSTLFHLIIQ